MLCFVCMYLWIIIGIIASEHFVDKQNALSNNLMACAITKKKKKKTERIRSYLSSMLRCFENNGRKAIDKFEEHRRERDR